MSIMKDDRFGGVIFFQFLNEGKMSVQTLIAYMKTSGHDSFVLHHEKVSSRWEIKTKKNGSQHLSKSSVDEPRTLVPLRGLALFYGHSQWPPVTWCLYSFLSFSLQWFPTQSWLCFLFSLRLSENEVKLTTSFCGCQC